MKRIKMCNYIIILLAILSTTVSCTQRVKQDHTVVRTFSIPEVPTVLTSPEQKAEFIVTHYWDNFAFTDTTLIPRADYTEQAYADFVNLLPHVPLSLAQRGIDTLMSRATADSAMYACFRKLSEKYLYDPNSPFRNEELYIAVLRNIVANSNLPEIERVRPQYQLNLALKNRTGESATDFEYTTGKGNKAKLYSAKGDKILLFFFRPDCETCKEVKEYVVKNGIDKLVPIVWVNPDVDTHLNTIYDLRASPTLYLLDKTKTILLKDASIEQIETYIKNN